MLLHSSGTVATALTLSGALTCSSTVDLSAAQISGTNALVFGGANTGNSNKLTLAVTDRHTPRKERLGFRWFTGK